MTGDGAEAAVAAFRAWRDFPYDLIIVTGYTPLDAREPVRLHPIARERIDDASRSFRARHAPFILTTGGAVHPEGTPYCEAVEMKRELVALGVAADRVVTEPRARHSTTNLRNAGRFMLAHGLTRGLVVAGGGWLVFNQAWYFAHPELSSFNRRCRRELGYVVGTLRKVDAARVAFTPAPECQRPGPDPLDP
jgi:hypothetical protein